MTVTFEELEAEGWSKDKVLEHWEWDNKSLQPHKFDRPFNLISGSLEQWWPLKDVHEFCLKLCAIYATVPIAFARELAEFLWIKWFRPRETPCRFGNFFARYIACYKPASPKTIPELLEAHRRICAQVLLRQVVLNASDIKPFPLDIGDRFDDPHENHENYRLEAIFHAVFIVIDTIPPFNSREKRRFHDREFAAATSVLLVRTGEHHDLATGPVDFAPVEALSETVDGNQNVRLNLASPLQHVSNVQLASRANVANGIELRILPLGDSITNGFQSTDNNGYRLTLQRDLAGSKLLFVGSQSGGTMDDNWHEGWNGYTIDKIEDKSSLSVAYFKPNIILVHAGTNDMNLNPPVDPEHAPDRLGRLIDNLIGFGTADSLILVAQIIGASNGQTNSLIQKYNEAIPAVVAKRATNHKVAVVDFRNALQASDYADGLHPNDNGYKKMGDIWFKAIQDAAGKGWIKPPQGPPPNFVGPDGLAKKPGSYCLTKPIWVPAINSKGGPIATGVGHNGDMKWTTNYDPHWPKAASGIGKNGSGVMFGDLNGDGRADYLHVNEKSGSVIAYLNTGVGDEISWAPVNDGKEIASGVAPRASIRFADIDQDGKDDYVVIGKAGSVTVYFNRGPDQAAPGGWNWDGPHEVAPGAPGAKGEDVFFGDINGDGRPDYLVKNSNGAVGAFLNIGKPKSIDGIQWDGVGQIASGFGTADITFADINGDGNDYLIWSSDNKGGLTGYLNYRTEKEGQPGWASTGGSGSVAGGTGRSSKWGRLADFNGDGKADYAVVGDKGELDVYINKGTADTSVIGDAVRLADLNGDGFDDYIFLEKNAAVRLYINGGEKSDGKEWIWVPIDNFKEIANGAGGKREQIIFADMDGDGKDDFVIVNPKSGALTLYKSGGENPKGGWIWYPVLDGKPIASGLGGPGSAIRLADLDGDGRCDYIQLGPNGEAKVYLNGGPGGDTGWIWYSYNDFKNIATGIGFTRDHVQFKDIDGDGKADYLGIGQLDGQVVAYRNQGPQPNGGWGWAPMNDAKPIATGIGSVGADVLWGRLEKTGRYSYLGIAPNSGALSNPSGGGSGGGSTGGSGSSGSGSGGSSSNPSGGGSSGGTGGGSGGGSGSGSNNDNGPDTYIDGGKPIPSGGLGSLGLPTVGIPAISALIPYAITAQNDLTTAQSIINGLKAGTPTSAGINTAVGVLSTLASDYAALSNQAKTWQLSSFNGDLNPRAKQEQADLEAARRAVSDLIPKLQACAGSLRPRDLPDCRPTLEQISSVLSGEGLSEPLSFLGSRGSVAGGSGSGSNSGGSGGTGGGSGGSGDSGDGGSGGSGGCGGLATLGGAVAIPSGGLAGLGLPTAGTAALTALKPFALAAQNAVAFASSLACSLGEGSSASEVSAAEDALGAAASDASAISAQANAIPLETFATNEASIWGAERTALENAAKKLSGLAPRLRAAFNKPAFKTAVLVVSSLLVGQDIIVPLYFLTGPKDPFTTPTPIGVSPPTPAGPGSESTSGASEWYISTIPGTSVKQFQDWIKGLPDKGVGRQYVYEHSNRQAYVGMWTEEESIIIHEDPIVDQQVPNTPLKMSHSRHIHDVSATPINSSLERRDDPRTILWREFPQRYQNILSLPKDHDIRSLPDSLQDDDEELAYTFDTTQGAGTYVYIFDAGFNWDHPEFKGRSHEEHIVTRAFNTDGSRSQDIRDEDGHGTRVAALVNGAKLGIAPEATVIGVKLTGTAKTFANDAVFEGWRWAIEDVKARNRQGKAIFAWTFVGYYTLTRLNNAHTPRAYQAPYNIPQPAYSDQWVPNIVDAWDAGIVTVFSAGNIPGKDPLITNMGQTAPQRYARPDNAMIVAGSIDRDGSKSSLNLLPGRPGGPRGNIDVNIQGEITTYAHARDILVAAIESPTEYDFDRGNSFASPQIAGLAAYLLGFLRLNNPGSFGSIPMAMKKHIVQTARDGTRDGAGTAYNGVRELVCDSDIPTLPNKKKLRRAAKDAMALDIEALGLLAGNLTVLGTDDF
ncbi:MAG: hypothetical protein Q9186_006574 [Xanthomendoza sp. 1 TL-2023]